LGAQAHITISAPEDTVFTTSAAVSNSTTLQQVQPRTQRPRAIVNWQVLVPVLEAMPAVAAVSPMVSGAGLAQRGEASKAIALMGVDLDRYDRIVGLRRKVVDGVARLGPGEAIVGRELASDLGLRVGDRMSIIVGGVNANSNVVDSVRVTALVDLGVRELNRRTLIVPLRAAQSLLGLPGGATNLDLTQPSWRSATPTRWKAGSRPMPNSSRP
jgi:lipoprotein-releasing system permease protein